jgi:hypothetical protein
LYISLFGGRKQRQRLSGLLGPTYADKPLADRRSAALVAFLRPIHSSFTEPTGMQMVPAKLRPACGSAKMARAPAAKPAFVPNVLRVVRAVTIVTVVLAVAQVWRIAESGPRNRLPLIRLAGISAPPMHDSCNE